MLVLGGGFGLYGHTAALARMNVPVATLSRYRDEASSRPELAALIDRIDWVDDEATAIAAAGGVVLARRPVDNAATAGLLPPSCRTVVIEKPIAPSADAADAVAACLAGRRWAVPYLFLYTDWGMDLIGELAAGGSGTIEWTHRQAAAAGPWKAAEEAGGGPLGFYLVHILALIAAALPDAVLTVELSGEDRVAIHAGTRLRVRFALAPIPAFEAVWSGASYRSAGPFGAAPVRGEPDPRIGPLQRFYHQVLDAPETLPPPSLHAAVHEHWRRLAPLLYR